MRGVERFADLADAGVRLTELTLGDPASFLPANAVLAHLIPPLQAAENAALRAVIEQLKPRRIVYVSSTGVYGEQTEVHAGTAAMPNDERGRLRFEEEQWIASGPWTSLVLRAAGIYGPGRGVHAALREGKLPRSAGSGIVSRIHVDDLATIVEAGMFSDTGGAWPVADDAPCSSDEVAAWCAGLLGLEVADQAWKPASSANRTMAGRKVDGRKIRETLGVELAYPSWERGIPACLAEEQTKGD